MVIIIFIMKQITVSLSICLVGIGAVFEDVARGAELYLLYLLFYYL